MVYIAQGVKKLEVLHKVFSWLDFCIEHNNAFTILRIG